MLLKSTHESSSRMRAHQDHGVQKGPCRSLEAARIYDQNAAYPSGSKKPSADATVRKGL